MSIPPIHAPEFIAPFLKLQSVRRGPATAAERLRAWSEWKPPTTMEAAPCHKKLAYDLVREDITFVCILFFAALIARLKPFSLPQSNGTKYR